MASYTSSTSEDRENGFKNFMRRKGKKEATIRSYCSSVKSRHVVSIIKSVSSKHSIYDVLSVTEANDIASRVRALPVDKTGHAAFSSPIKMYKSFLEWLEEDDTEASEMSSGEGSKESSSGEDHSGGSSSSMSSVDILSVIDGIKKSGLLYSDDLISRFVISLLTKPFVILSGLSGSGKTQLAIAFAKAMSEKEEQICIVPVGADWTNREPLLGYPNALEEGKYVLPDSGVLQLLMKAAGDEERPYFLILDEMNLSYVERYFADFLSAMESHEEIPLWNEKSKAASEETETESGEKISSKVKLPSNLFIIGTINVDETTYMFSPKVLDRANVIEFKIDEKEMSSYLDAAVNVDVESISGSLSGMALNFVELAKNPVATGFVDSKDILLDFFKKLKSVNAEFGFRSAKEIGRFVALSRMLGTLADEKAVDAAIVQKLLPKLHGSRKKLTPVLSELWRICLPEADVTIDKAKAVPETIKYPLSADKILRMYRGATDNGFTSFAEA